MYILEKNPTTQIRVAVKQFKGKTYVDIRQWWRKEEETNDDNAWKFSKKGVTIPLTKWEDFKRGIEDEVDVTQVDEGGDIE